MQKRLATSALVVAACTASSVALQAQNRSPANGSAQNRSSSNDVDDGIREMVRKKGTKIIIDELGVTEAEVTLDARFIEELGADSLDTVELVMRAEEEFGIEIPDADAEKLVRVRDAYKYVVKRLRQNKK